MHNELFPTEFACSIGIESKLMLRERKNRDSKKRLQRNANVFRERCGILEKTQAVGDGRTSWN